MQATPDGKILTVEELMARVRAAATRPENPLAARLRAATAAPRHYRLEEFTPADTDEFIYQAFIRLLLRPPDAAGVDYYREQLAAGRLTRLEIIYALATAPEGTGYNITVDGLDELHNRLFRSHLLGWLRRHSGFYDKWLHLDTEGLKR